MLDTCLWEGEGGWREGRGKMRGGGGEGRGKAKMSGRGEGLVFVCASAVRRALGAHGHR